MSRGPLLSILIVSLVCGRAGAAESALVDARERLGQWVQTQQLIAKTRADGDASKELLLQTKAIHERELKALEENLLRSTTNSTQIATERAKAESDLAHAEEGIDALRGALGSIEGQVRALIPVFPPPLLEQLQPLLNRIPEKAEATRAGATERLQTVVTLLNEVDKFQQAVTVSGGRQKDSSGREVSVETLYLGLGAAYFSDATGGVAGVGVPGAAGWVWTLKPEIGGVVRDALAMYRNARPAAFVGLPLRIEP